MTLTSLLASALLSAAPGDCKECVPNDLCAAHQESDGKAIDKLRGKVRARDVQQRLDALREVAALTKGHENAPSRAVADTLALGLQDDDFEVRAVAAELLSSGQHPDEALKALVKALDDVRTQYAKVGRDKERGGGDAGFGGDGGAHYVEAVIGGLAKLPDDRAVDALADVVKKLQPDAPDDFVGPLTSALLALGSR